MSGKALRCPRTGREVGEDQRTLLANPGTTTSEADTYVVYDSFFTDRARGIVDWAAARMSAASFVTHWNGPTRIGEVLTMSAHLYGVEKASRQNGLRVEALRLAPEQDVSPMRNQLRD